MMKKSFSLLTAFVVAGNVLFAQDLEQGKKFFYYERYKSAKETLQKVVDGNPGNTEAVYWLGETLFRLKDSVGAQKLFQDALAKNSSDPFILAGAGHSDLKFAKLNDARQKFEAAITATKGRSIDVFNAVARANVEAKLGDADYAIEKLTAATNIKKFNSPETYVLMGDAYRKKGDGGQAIVSYKNALNLDARYAAATYKIGKIYQTQNNEEIFIPAFEDAITFDPGYKPAYYELFYHYYSKDMAKADQYLKGYEANADRDDELEYLKVDWTYIQGQYQAAKNRALELVAEMGDRVSPRMYRLAAFASDTLGQPAEAKQYIETFFTKADEDVQVIPTDYLLLAKSEHLLGNNEAALAAIIKGDHLETDETNKVRFINDGLALTKRYDLKSAEAYVLGAVYRFKPTPSNVDLYNYAVAYYQAEQFDSSYALFNEYKEKYPDEIYGYLWAARSSVKIGAEDYSDGIAAKEWYEFIDIVDSLGQADKQKDNLQWGLGILAQYEYNINKDIPKALEHFKRILEINPENAQVKQYVEVLEKIQQQQKG